MKPPKLASQASENTRAWWRYPGFIYFIAAGNPPKAIKIGMAAITSGQTLKTAVLRRLAQIQSSNHELIELVGVIHFDKSEFPTRDAEARERELHLRFAHLRRFQDYKRGSEWFSPSPELRRLIESSAKKPELLGLPRTYSRVVS